MASSKQNRDALYCLIRKTQVLATKEEYVRQRLLRTMIEEWGYPASLIQVEKAISPLRRRFDIIAFSKKENTLLPLLVVECKAYNENMDTALLQLMGYNTVIQAPFLALANPDGLFCFSSQKERIEKPTYATLLQL